MATVSPDEGRPTPRKGHAMVTPVLQERTVTKRGPISLPFWECIDHSSGERGERSSKGPSTPEDG